MQRPRQNAKCRKIQLPVDAKGKMSRGCRSAEVKHPAIDPCSVKPWFHVNKSGKGVVFCANLEGCTTSGSQYARSELREVEADGKTKASWSTSSGTHVLQIREAVTHLPDVKPQTVIAQIHDGDRDVVGIVVDGSRSTLKGTARICYRMQGPTQPNCLDNNYVLGTPFNLQIRAAKGRVNVAYNGVQKLNIPLNSTGNYFKAGSYTQSNLSKGDKAGAYGEVVMYNISVSHS